jgi:CubicO group peptidase (beta-lactamase class C family)
MEDPSHGRTAYYPKKGSFAALPNQYYKYMWWGMRRDEGKNDFFARGNHGQFVYVSPHKNLIIVRHGERYGVPAEKWVEILFQFSGMLK